MNGEIYAGREAETAACAAALLDEIGLDGTRDAEADWHAAWVAAWLRYLLWQYSPTPSVVEAAVELDVTPWRAFEQGGRIRTDADVRAMAATMPPMTPERQKQHDEWVRTTAALTPAQLIKRWGGQLGIHTARDIIALCRDGVAERDGTQSGLAA